MTAISLDLIGKLDAERERVLRDVAEAAVALGIPFFVVGAFARDLILELHYGLPVQRATNDIDFGLRVNSWEEFTQLKTALIETQTYRADLRQPQRLHSTTGCAGRKHGNHIWRISCERGLAMNCGQRPSRARKPQVVVLSPLI
jgi:hypothetical protein